MTNLKTTRKIPGFKAHFHVQPDGTTCDEFRSTKTVVSITPHGSGYRVTEMWTDPRDFLTYRDAMVHVMMRLQTS